MQLWFEIKWYKKGIFNGVQENKKSFKEKKEEIAMLNFPVVDLWTLCGYCLALFFS